MLARKDFAQFNGAENARNPIFLYNFTISIIPVKKENTFSAIELGMYRKTATEVLNIFN